MIRNGIIQQVVGGVTYTYKPLVINHIYVEEDLTAFPVVITEGLFDDVDFNESESSLRFYDADLNLIPHEVVEFNAGHTEIWVKTDISADTDTTIYYGFNGGSKLPETDVWATNYVFVSHMDIRTGNYLYDSVHGTLSAKQDTVIDDSNGGFSRFGSSCHLGAGGDPAGVNFGNNPDYNVPLTDGELTMEYYGYVDVTGSTNYVISKTGDAYGLIFGYTANKWEFYRQPRVVINELDVTGQTYEYVAFSIDYNNDVYRQIYDGNILLKSTTDNPYEITDEDLKVLSYNTENQKTPNAVDELRVLKKYMPEAYFKANYYMYTYLADFVTKNPYDDVSAVWKFDETSGDYVYEELTNLSGTTNAEVWDGIDGKCRYFNAPKQTIIPHNEAMSTSGPLTVSSWVKHEPTISDAAFIIYKGTYPDYEYRMSIKHKNESHDLFTFDKTVGGTFYELKTLNLTPVDGEWYHLVGVFDGDEMRIYVNGNLEGTMSASGKGSVTTKDVKMGQYETVTPNYDWNGYIDETAFWKRALSEQEIKYLYRDGYGQFYKESFITDGLISFWTFDNISGSTVFDSYGTADGVLTDTSAITTDGRTGKAAIFKSARVDIDNDYILTASDPYSMSYWIKRGTDVNTVIIPASNLDSSVSSWCDNYIMGTTVRLNLIYNNTDGRRFYNSECYPLEEKGWHHFVLTYNGTATSDGGKIYKDGIEQSHTYSDSMNYTGQLGGHLYLGSRNGTTYSDVDARLDEIGIWNRVLTPTEIKHLYRDGYGRFYNYDIPRKGLTAYYKFDESSGGYTKNEVNGYDASISSVSIFDTAGYKKGCLNFDNQYYVTIDTAEAATYTNDTGFTYSFMTYITNDGAIDRFIDRGGAAGGTRLYRLSVDYANSTEGDWRVTIGDQDGNWVYAEEGSTHPTYGRWVNVAWVMAGDRYTIWEDGVPVMSDFATINIGTSRSVDLTLGDINDLSSQCSAKMDELYAWNKPLTEEEIHTVYKAMGGSIEDEAIIHYTFNDASRFNEGFGKSRYDLYLQSADGTLSETGTERFIKDGYAEFNNDTDAVLATSESVKNIDTYKHSTFIVHVQNASDYVSHYQTPLAYKFYNGAPNNLTFNLFVLRASPTDDGNKRWYAQFYHDFSAQSVNGPDNSAANTNDTVLSATFNNGTLTFYLNGDKVGSVAIPSEVTTTDDQYHNELSLGASYTDGQSSFPHCYEGKIYEVQVYDKVLSDDEIKSISYNLLGITLPVMDGLVIHYGDKVNGGTNRIDLQDGTIVNAWDDMSGNGYRITALDANPVINGNSLYFNGVNNMLQYGGYTTISGTTVKTEFLVFEAEDTASTEFMISYGDTDSSGLQNSFLLVQGGTPIGNGTGMFQSDYRTYNKNMVDSNGDGWIPNKKYIWVRSTWEANNTYETNRINAFDTDVLTYNNGPYNIGCCLHVGGWYDESRQFKGKMYEYIVYNRALSLSEIEAIEAYLNNKYNIY